MTIDEFLTNVRRIQAADPRYRLGRDGSDGYCDCIGLVIGAIRRSGGQWRGIHGTNWTARNAMHDLNPLRGAGQLRRGGQLRDVHEAVEGALLQLGDAAQLLLQLVIHVLHGDEIRRHGEHGQDPQHQREHLVAAGQEHEDHQSHGDGQQCPHAAADAALVGAVQRTHLLQQTVV